MRRFRPTDVVRVLLAVAVLAGSVGSTPTFGHAHEKPDADDHDHLDWAAHEHSHSHLQATHEDEHHAAIEANDAVFHLHGMMYGIPFSLPIQPDDARQVANPLAMAVLTPNMAIIASQFKWAVERIIGPDAFALAFSSQVGIAPSAGLLSRIQPLDPPGGHCALDARSGVLRC